MPRCCFSPLSSSTAPLCNFSRIIRKCYMRAFSRRLLRDGAWGGRTGCLLSACLCMPSVYLLPTCHPCLCLSLLRLTRLLSPTCCIFLPSSLPTARMTRRWRETHLAPADNRFSFRLGLPAQNQRYVLFSSSGSANVACAWRIFTAQDASRACGFRTGERR